MTAQELKTLEARLWQAADRLRVDSDLKASEYSTPVLGLIFLRFATIRYDRIVPQLNARLEAQQGSRLQQSREEIAMELCGFYLPAGARYDYLLSLPEEAEIDKAIKHAMELIEGHKKELAGVLPKDEYFRLTRRPDSRSLPKDLLKIFADIPDTVSGDVFGRIYEYFLAEFALSEGQGGGEFFTPPSVVKLMVEIIEPYSGTIFDPACGSGGMFVQSSAFIDRRREELHDEDTKNIFVYGQEKTMETVKLAQMNLAVNGLRGEIKQANTFYEDLFHSYEAFDFVLANPPFNVDDVNLEKVKSDRRFNTYGIPQNKTKKSAKESEKNPDTVPNANYLWISLFATSLKPAGRAALVMANSASDARNSEADIRRALIKDGVIEVMLTLPKNMFYTVTLPATLWFFDKRRQGGEPRVLFIDARNIFRQIDRAHREFTDEHLQNIATIVRLYRGEGERLDELTGSYEARQAAAESEAAVQARFIADKEAELAAFPELTKEFLEAESSKEFKERVKAAAAINAAIAEAGRERAKHEAAAAYYGAQIAWLQERFPDGVYADVTGLCKAATLAEMEEQDWSLNPGRYVGVVIEEDGLTEEEFLAEMRERHEALIGLQERAGELEGLIQQNLLAFS